MRKDFIEKAIKDIEKTKNEEELQRASTKYARLFKASELYGTPERVLDAIEKKKLKFEKKMTYQEFRKTYEHNNKWKFDLFEIVCKKCGSKKVEFNGNMELEPGYYGDSSVEGRIIVKCHNCGNAFELQFNDLGD